MPERCRQFCEKMAYKLSEDEGLKRCLTAHLLMMWELALIKPSELDLCMQIVANGSSSAPASATVEKTGVATSTVKPVEAEKGGSRAKPGAGMHHGRPLSEPAIIDLRGPTIGPRQQRKDDDAIIILD